MSRFHCSCPDPSFELPRGAADAKVRPHLPHHRASGTMKIRIGVGHSRRRRNEGLPSTGGGLTVASERFPTFHELKNLCSRYERSLGSSIQWWVYTFPLTGLNPVLTHHPWTLKICLIALKVEKNRFGKEPEYGHSLFLQFSTVTSSEPELFTFDGHRWRHSQSRKGPSISRPPLLQARIGGNPEQLNRDKNRDSGHRRNDTSQMLLKRDSGRLPVPMLISLGQETVQLLVTAMIIVLLF
ncbi:hypothetical protein EDD85DRAFT_939414 [Armillaria nabsnona]|nr:hypothetical protein EDD85DRAFT_939414 [Armillaria nabsnona]